MNTPFQWGKQVASHLGGVRNPLVISWPARIKDKGGIRTQFHHVIDMVPTILEAASIPEPTEVNGVKQKPIEGVSMLYSFDDAHAKGTRTVQYFEMFGNRAIYQDPWIATCRHGRLPWQNSGTVDFDKDIWELYNLDDDFSESHDLSATNPEKLKELQELFWKEAEKYQVLPLDDRFIERADPSLRPSLIAGRTHFTYLPSAVRIPESSSPNVKNRTHTISVDVDIPNSGANGVLVAAGGVVGGYALYIQDGRPVYTYNYFNLERYTVTGSSKLPAGPTTIRFEFTYEGNGLGKGGTGRLFVNGKKVGEGHIAQTIPARFSADETFDTGMDTGSPAGNYASPFRFTGTLKKVVIDLQPENLAIADQHKVQQLITSGRLTSE